MSKLTIYKNIATISHAVKMDMRLSVPNFSHLEHKAATVIDKVCAVYIQEALKKVYLPHKIRIYTSARSALDVVCKRIITTIPLVIDSISMQQVVKSISIKEDFMRVPNLLQLENVSASLLVAARKAYDTALERHIYVALYGKAQGDFNKWAVWAQCDSNRWRRIQQHCAKDLLLLQVYTDALQAAQVGFRQMRQWAGDSPARWKHVKKQCEHNPLLHILWLKLMRDKTKRIGTPQPKHVPAKVSKNLELFHEWTKWAGDDPTRCHEILLRCKNNLHHIKAHRPLLKSYGQWRAWLKGHVPEALEKVQLESQKKALAHTSPRPLVRLL